MYIFKILSDNTAIGNEVVRPENFKKHKIQFMKIRIRNQ